MQDHEKARADLAALMARHDITIESTFVPLSRVAPERRKDWGDRLTLNWRFAVKRGARVILEGDYTQGIGHAPSSKIKIPDRFSELQAREMRREAAELEAETGCEARYLASGHGAIFAGKPLPPPDPVDIWSSLMWDCDVLDSGGFENWAGDLGYDPDSRKAEAAYRVCVETALKLLGAVGADTLREMRELAREM